MKRCIIYVPYTWLITNQAQIDSRAMTFMFATEYRMQFSKRFYSGSQNNENGRITQIIINFHINIYAPIGSPHATKE